MKSLTLNTPRLAAATAAAALLAAATLTATPANAAEDSTVTELTLNGVTGTVSITVPTGDTANPLSLGDLDISSGTQTLDNTLGEVTVNDSTTGLLRVATVNVSSDLNTGTVGFCIDDDGDISGGITCSADTNEQILSTAVNYDFAGVTESGAGLGDTVENDGALGVASAVFTQTAPGAYAMTWDPALSVTMLDTQTAGTYYGSIKHSVTTAGV